MSKLAWIYISTVLVLAAAVGGLTLPGLVVGPGQWLIFACLVGLATFAQLFEAEAPKRQSYYPAMVFFFAGVLLLPASLFVALVVMPHLVEWAKARLTRSPRLRAWYIQPFNIANHVLAGFAAQATYSVLDFHVGPAPTPAAVLAVTLSASLYVLVNHVLIGQVLVLARSITWRESGILAFEGLVTDTVLMMLGYMVAVLWEVSPWLIAPALAPLALMHRAMLVPKLKEEAQTDIKTGLWNARHFTTLFTTELDRARRFQRPLALIVADLDLLRNINNTYGHLAGDTVLAGIGQQIRQTIREYDIAARFGGEEFVIVLPETDLAEAQAVAERLRLAMQEARFAISTSPTPIGATLSLGVASFPNDATDAEALIHAADTAVYQAKHLGRNRVVCAADITPTDPLSPPQPGATPIPPAALTRRLPSAADQPSPNDPANSLSSGAPPVTPTQTQPSTTPTEPHSPRALLRLFVGAVIAAGCGTAVLGVMLQPRLGLMAILLFTVAAAVAEWFQVRVYGQNSVSASVAFVIAAALVAGIPGVAVVSLGIVLVDQARRQPPLYRTAFNWAVHLLAGVVPTMVVSENTVPTAASPFLLVLGAVAGASLIYFIVETGLIATAMGLAQGESLAVKWRQQFRWLAIHYLVLGILGLFLSIGYQALGWLGIVAFSLPVLMMRYAQKQFIQQTEQVMRELKHLIGELLQANRDTIVAGEANRRLNAELFLTLAKIVDSRDPAVASHATKVADYAVAIAAELGLPAERIGPLRQAGLLHDLGKVAIPDHLLSKVTPLAAAEYAVLKSHATLGAAFLETCRNLRHLAPFVRHHHEWWDGGGYPAGLAAEAIPLEARILGVCDAVEAMASDRPYRRATPSPAILAELQRCSGSQFDPTVVEVFVRLATRLGDGFITNSHPLAHRHPTDQPSSDPARSADELVIARAS